MAKIIEIGPLQTGIRLDKFIQSKFPRTDLKTVRKFIRKKDISINGSKTSTDHCLKNGDKIQFSDFVYKILSNPQKERETAENMAVAGELNCIYNNIIYENENLLILNKPYGLAVQGGTAIATSLDRLLKKMPIDGEKPKLVHRLDRYTTGVLLVAKNIETANELKRIFKEKRHIGKEYIAIVIGKIAKNSGIIDCPLTKKYEDGIEKVYVDRVNGKEAITSYEVLAYSSRYNLSLVRVRILTGRTHQIRVHFREIGNPLLGDFKYGKKAQYAVKNLEELQKKKRVNGENIRIGAMDGSRSASSKFTTSTINHAINPTINSTINPTISSIIDFTANFTIGTGNGTTANSAMTIDVHRLHLHARRVSLRFDGKNYVFRANLPEHMRGILKNGEFERVR